MLEKEKEDLNEPFGLWMFVSKLVKARGSRREKQRYGVPVSKVNQSTTRKESVVVTKSRFASLENIEDEETVDKAVRYEKDGRSDHSDNVGPAAVWVKKKLKKTPIVGEASTSTSKERKGKISNVSDQSEDRTRIERGVGLGPNVKENRVCQIAQCPKHTGKERPNIWAGGIILW